MKALTFSLLAEPEERLDLSGLTTAALAGLTALQIAKLRIGTGRNPVLAGDIFKITGKDADEPRHRRQ